MAINLTTEFQKKVEERFALKSITDAYAGKAYDFSGVKSIKIYSIDSVPVVDYNRAGRERYGQLTELGDTVQELTMTQDKGFTFSVDEGNASDQMNIKQVTTRLRTNWDERATPMIDMYRFNRWIEGAGLGATVDTALTKGNIVETIMTATAAMSNVFVPLANRVMFIKESVYIGVKLAAEIVGIDSLGEKSVKNGVVGEMDGMKIVRVPDSYLPNGVNFLVKWKNATVDPMKLKTMHVQKKPMGVDGDVGECRFYYDSFVLDNKMNGLYVHAMKANAAVTPTIAIAGGNATITSATSGAAIKYTLDGSNPKTSPSAAVYSAAVPVTAGQTVRAFASKAGLISSGASEATA